MDKIKLNKNLILLGLLASLIFLLLGVLKIGLTTKLLLVLTQKFITSDCITLLNKSQEH